MKEVRNNLVTALDRAVAEQPLQRCACWTESLAVGSVEFLEQTQPLILSRRQTDIVQEQSTTPWVLKEDARAYGKENELKKQRKALK